MPEKVHVRTEITPDAHKALKVQAAQKGIPLLQYLAMILTKAAKSDKAGEK